LWDAFGVVNSPDPAAQTTLAQKKLDGTIRAVAGINAHPKFLPTPWAFHCDKLSELQKKNQKSSSRQRGQADGGSERLER
jgi:hypothetical protein